MDRKTERLPKALYVAGGLAAIVITQALVYFGTRFFLPGRELHVLTGALDAHIPFIPAWIVVYLLAFPTWVIGAVLILSESRSHARLFLRAYILALLLAGLIFLLWPGTMARPQLLGDGFFIRLTRLIYEADTPTNLCPSLHVLSSFFCWRGTLGCRKIPSWYSVFNLIFLLLVCFSVLFVKQHALIDIPVAILLGEATVRVSLFLDSRTK